MAYSPQVGWCGQAVRGRSPTADGVLLLFWHLPYVHNELVAVGRVHGDGQPHGHAVPVEGGPEYFVYRDPAIRRQLEEVFLGRVGCAHSNPVAITDLVDAECIGQVLHGSLFDVAGAPEPLRTAVRELHRVIRRQHRPRGTVDEAPLMPADDLCAFGYPQPRGDIIGGLLDLDLERAGRGCSVQLAYLRQVAGTFGDAWTSRIAGQGVDEGVDLLRDEGALAWAGLDQSQGGEQFDRVADGVARRPVALPQLDLGQQLLTWLELARLDLLAQIFSDLPIHGIRHRPSSGARGAQRLCDPACPDHPCRPAHRNVFLLAGLYPARRW